MKMKPIPGYEGYYNITEDGNIFNVQRGQFRSLRINKNGYIDIDLYKDGQCRWHRVHRLVAQAFLPNPNNYTIVMHKDNNKTNNHVSNLEWGTISMNTIQAYQDGCIDIRKDYVIYNLLLDDYIICHGQSALLNELNLSQSTIQSIILNNTEICKGEYYGYKIARLERKFFNDYPIAHG